jgi:hypothetical protein
MLAGHESIGRVAHSTCSLFMALSEIAGRLFRFFMAGGDAVGPSDPFFAA